jgi:hypothetical protein
MRNLFALTGVVLVALSAAAAEVPGQFVDLTPTFVPPSMSGRDTFRYYCTSCHGESGRGTGPLAGQLKTRPADLTRLAANNGGVFPVARVRASVTDGVGRVGAHGSADMPVWGPILQSLDPSDANVQARIENVIGYLQTIQRR